MSGGVPPAKPWPSCWLRSEATTTSAVLPVFFAQVSAADLTAAVSASPDVPIRICSFAGPDDCWGFEPWSKPPPPQAVRASDVVAATTRARGVLRLMGAPRGGGAVRRVSDDLGNSGV